MGRTGSTLLTHLLNSHPDTEFHGELFAPGGWFESQSQWNRRTYLESAAYNTEARVKGFKMPFDWILNYPGIFEDLRALSYKAILLRRRNRLDHFVSMRLAEQNKDWSSEQPYENQAVTVDRWTFQRFAAFAAAVELDMLPKLVAGLDVFVIDYADLLNPSTQTELLDFLGLDHCELTTPTIKARERRLSDAVVNFAELREFFAGSPYAGYFPNPD